MNPRAIKTQASQLLSGATKVISPLRQLQLSPLSLIVLGALSATAMIAALFAVYGVLGPVDSGETVATQEWTPPTLSIVELDPPKPAAGDVQSLSRPIFSKSRRPSPKAAKTASVDTSANAAAPSGLTVNAVVKNKKTMQAFVVSSDSPEGAWKKVGDTVDSWSLAAIDSAGILLKNGAQTARVLLYTPAESAPPEQAANPAGLAIPEPPPH